MLFGTTGCYGLSLSTGGDKATRSANKNIASCSLIIPDLLPRRCLQLKQNQLLLSPRTNEKNTSLRNFPLFLLFPQISFMQIGALFSNLE
jgi:hypothetical protein